MSHLVPLLEFNHLARSPTDGGGRHLYVVDESSLASTRQVNEFLHRLQDQDRVIFVGDTRQHQGVEAGRPFQQLQEAGMPTAHLDEIIRQKDPAPKEAVQQLAHGQVQEAIGNLKQQGRVMRSRTARSGWRPSPRLMPSGPSRPWWSRRTTARAKRSTSGSTASCEEQEAAKKR